MNDDWQPIETAPRNGKIIEVMSEDAGQFTVKWNSTGYNWIVSDKLGIWESPEGTFTWSDKAGFGPTHWRHYQSVTK